MSELKEPLLKKFKQQLVEKISVSSIEVDDIKNDEPIFGPDGQLQLDSLDALELVILLETNFDIKLKGKASSTVIFKNFNVLGDYIIENTPNEKLESYLHTP